MINNSESILVLKEKFNEIKRNINLIEQKQSDFFNNSRKMQPDLNKNDFVSRPASAGRFIDRNMTYQHRPDQTVEDLKRENKRLRMENEELTKKMARFDSIVKENEELKRRMESSGPVPCIKQSGSSPKKHRVAFSKDLVQVVHVGENDVPSSIKKAEPDHCRREIAEPIRASSPFRTQARVFRDVDNSRFDMYKKTDYSEAPKDYENFYLKYQPQNEYVRRTLNSTSPVPIYRNDLRRSYQPGEGYYSKYRY